MKVKFINVGRNDRTWESETEAKSFNELDDFLYNEVKEKGGVLSNNISFEMNNSDYKGKIIAGYHIIGEFEIF